MEKLYAAVGSRRQYFHAWLNGRLRDQELEGQLLPIIRQIREDHPNMSARIMYDKIQPYGMGRDKFIAFCKENGFGVLVKRNYRKTTDSRGVTRFPNLIKDMEITAPHQVWVSDITYYNIAERYYYLTFIMDLYSRFIVGYSASTDLRTINTTLPALEMALRLFDPPGIGHSDGGGQYYCKGFLELTKAYSIQNSMTEDVGQNNHAERLNGTIKNDYMSFYMPTCYSSLKKELARAVRNYNYDRPHQSLQKQTPAHILGLNQTGETRMKEAIIDYNNPVVTPQKPVILI